MKGKDTNNSGKESSPKDKNISRIFPKALNLVSKSFEHPSNIKLKGLGLHLVLLGLAEVQARRVATLSNVLINLEEKVFSKDILDNVSPDKLIGLYRMALDSLNDSSGYIKDLVKFVDFKFIEESMLVIDSLDEAVDKSDQLDDTSARKIAEEILKIMSSTHLVGVQVTS